MTKEEIKSYLKNNEFDFARANAAFIACDLAFGAYISSDNLHHIHFSPLFCYLLKEDLSHFNQIVAKKIIADTAKRIYTEYCEEPESLDDRIKEHVNFEALIDNLWLKYLKIRGGLSLKESLPIYREFIELSVSWWHYASMGEDKGALIHEIIVPKFAKGHGLDFKKADKLFNHLSHPEEKTILNIEREHFLNICLLVIRGENYNKAVADYIKKFFWFKSDFYKAIEITPESLITETQKEIKQKGEKKIYDELENIKESFKRLHADKLELIKNLKLTEEDKKDLVFAEKTILWIDIRKRGMMKDFYYFFAIIEDISEKSNISYHELSMYMVDEMDRFLETGERVSKEELARRGKGVFIVWEKKEGRQMFYDDDAKELFKIHSLFNKDEDIKGQVASTGGVKEIKGWVRVVYQPTKEDFNEGEILVTSMTRVEFVPLMRKAKAIITDEGGIACHAAIVSRELGLPCIIGTKTATRALKNGDFVEIDTEKGIVKILKHKD